MRKENRRKGSGCTGCPWAEREEWPKGKEAIRCRYRPENDRSLSGGIYGGKMPLAGCVPDKGSEMAEIRRESINREMAEGRCITPAGVFPRATGYRSLLGAERGKSGLPEDLQLTPEECWGRIVTIYPKGKEVLAENWRPAWCGAKRTR